MLSRRDFLRSAGSGLTGMSALTHFIGGCSTKSSKPNILFITMDTAGSKHFGCYGYKRDTTPNLDRFSEDALLFENSYSSGNQTLPSHASIFTGLYPHNHGAIHQENLKNSVLTIGTILQMSGYETTAITSTDFLNSHMIGNGFQNFISPKNEVRNAEKTLEIAKDFLSKKREKTKPFFLWIHLWDPHAPYIPPRPFQEKFLENKSKDLKELAKLSSRKIRMFHSGAPLPEELSQNDARIIIAQHDGEISYMDSQLGLFFEYLKRKGLYEDTILTVTSDHGESLSEEGCKWTAHHFIFEPVTQIPLIMRHPDYKSKRIKGLVQNIDIVPTILSWLGLEASDFDGIDMIPLIANGRDLRKEIYYSETGNTVYGMTDGKFKIRKHVLRKAASPETPQHWISELNLPRIEFITDKLEEINFNDVNGVIEYSWECLGKIANEIDTYAIEAAPLGIIASYNESILRSENKASFKKRFPKRFWNQMASLGTIPYRIVGKNSVGKIIASSEVMNRVCDAPLGRQGLFDLSNDPDEKNNIALDNPQLLSTIGTGLDTFIKESLRVLDNRDEHVQFRLEDQEALRAQGYL